MQQVGVPHRGAPDGAEQKVEARLPTSFPRSRHIPQWTAGRWRRRLYQVPLKIDAVTLEDGAGTPLAQFDKVRGVIALVETVETRHVAPPPPGAPRRAGAMVGGGVALAAVGFVAGLVAGAFLAGGLDDGGW